MSIVFTIAEISKLNLGPGDVLNVKLIGDEFTDEHSRDLQQQYQKLFPNNKIVVFLLPRATDVQMEVVKTAAVIAENPRDAADRANEASKAGYAALEAQVAKDCSVPTNYCNDCACGKKERILAEEQPRLKEMTTDEFLSELSARATKNLESAWPQEQMKLPTVAEIAKALTVDSEDGVVNETQKTIEEIENGTYKPEES